MPMPYFSALALLPFLVVTANNPQRPNWDMTNASSINQTIQSLPAADQQAIVQSVKHDPANLRAQAVETATGRLFIVQGTGSELCSPTGTCSFWVLNNDDQVLLHAFAQNFKLQPTTHAGKPDLITGMNNEAATRDLELWQFDGAEYVPNTCAQLDYTDPDGTPYLHPALHTKPCGPR
jgi:hypothetical protein